MNKIALSLLAAVVLGQLSWLGYNYHARVQEIAVSPHILLAVEQYDPRDLFRGDYVSIDVSEEIPLVPDEPRLGKSLYWEEGKISAWRNGQSEELNYPARGKQTEDAVRLYSWSPDALAAFVRADADGLWHICRVEAAGCSEDVCREGEKRLPDEMCAHFSWGENAAGEHIPVCDISLRRSLRYYVPEKKGNLVWEMSRNTESPKKVKVTMECVLREKNGLIPVQLFVDGVPYLEAYARWEKAQGGKEDGAGA